MRCPYCAQGIHVQPQDSASYYPDESSDEAFVVHIALCPLCGELFVVLRYGPVEEDLDVDPSDAVLDEVIYPRHAASPPLPPEVPEDIRKDFVEASLVLSLSSKASAALSRRLLQRILRERWGIKHQSLAKEIEEFRALAGIPSYLSEALDAVRAVGNLATHPTKDEATGLIVDVEPGEVEWLLEVIELLCDFSYVQPKRFEQRKTQLNEKLKAAGKPPV